jgi:uncharacterized membrane protein
MKKAKKHVKKHAKTHPMRAKKAKKEAKKIVKKADRKHHAKDKGEHKVEKVMREYKEGKLHSGSKKGPKVKNPKQAIAIGLSEARKAGARIPKKK